jgi:hypothetical protein
MLLTLAIYGVKRVHLLSRACVLQSDSRRVRDRPGSARTVLPDSVANCKALGFICCAARCTVFLPLYLG